MRGRAVVIGPSQSDEGRALVREVRELCSRESLFPRASRALVLVSGGQDSTTVLEVLAGGLLRSDGPSEVVALHVNHHLRGRDSDDDEALVSGHCSRLGVDLTVAHRPIEKSRGNVQEEARSARRQAALTTAAEKGCDRIVLGHTLDDQVETILYRMAKYGGLAALRGMRALRSALGAAAADGAPVGHRGVLSPPGARVRCRPWQRVSGLCAHRGAAAFATGIRRCSARHGEGRGQDRRGGGGGGETGVAGGKGHETRSCRQRGGCGAHPRPRVPAAATCPAQLAGGARGP